jgi:hypothetical protein
LKVRVRVRVRVRFSKRNEPRPTRVPRLVYTVNRIAEARLAGRRQGKVSVVAQFTNCWLG